MFAGGMLSSRPCYMSRPSEKPVCLKLAGDPAAGAIALLSSLIASDEATVFSGRIAVPVGVPFANMRERNGYRLRLIADSAPLGSATTLCGPRRDLGITDLSRRAAIYRDYSASWIWTAENNPYGVR